MIGIFDSGVGGISVMREIVKLLSNEDVLYVADSAHCPYGNKTAGEVLRLSQNIVRFLMDKHCKIIVVACNTATSAAIDFLRKQYPDFPFVGMEPAVKPATHASQRRRIGVLATEGTLHGRLFQQTVQQYAQDVDVQIVVGAGLVELVEAGKEDTQEAIDVLKNLLQPLMDKEIDCLVLGCTHYPFLRASIENITKGKIAIIDSAMPVALQTKRIMEEQRLFVAEKHSPAYHFYTSGDSAVLQRMQDRYLHLHNVSYAKF
ncbi:glutamate racemase [Bacteroidia bacterium]|nr:glutamate racemase [Bacteroidia bacterium]